MRNGLLIASAMLAASCDANQEQTPDQAEATGTASANDAADQMSASTVSASQPVTSSTFVTLATTTDLFAIESGKLAMKNGQSAATRAFARTMVDDHTASHRDLKAAVERSGMTVVLPTRLDAEHQGLLDQLAQANVDDFDRNYMNQQLDAHRSAIKLHEEYQVVADNADLRAFSQKVLPVIQKHYDQLAKPAAAQSNAMTGSVKQ